MTMMTLDLGCKSASTRQSKCCSLIQASGRALGIDPDSNVMLTRWVLGWDLGKILGRLGQVSGLKETRLGMTWKYFL